MSIPYLQYFPHTSCLGSHCIGGYHSQRTLVMTLAASCGVWERSILFGLQTSVLRYLTVKEAAESKAHRRHFCLFSGCRLTPSPLLLAVFVELGALEIGSHYLEVEQAEEWHGTSLQLVRRLVIGGLSTGHLYMHLFRVLSMLIRKRLLDGGDPQARVILQIFKVVLVLAVMLQNARPNAREVHGKNVAGSRNRRLWS